MSEPTRHSALRTDLYELTMAAAYFENHFRCHASFELFVRALPPQRSFLLAAGLEQALDYLESFHFEADEIGFLRRHPVFRRVSDSFFHYLKDLRFRGEVWAVPEGTVVFGEEPWLRVTAPIIEGQIVETFLLSMLAFQSLIASKAARVVEAAQGRGVVEFGTRRAHGPEAGVLAARAAYLGGCLGTSNVEAGLRFGIPTFGTVAHSFIMSYAEEEEALRNFLRVFPDDAVLLVDTYDTLAAVDKIVHLGLRPRGVRLDSGNLVKLSREVRRRLDRAGLRETKIFASGDLDEDSISAILAQGAAVDAFGVGTALSTSKDAPALGSVYKLVQIQTGSDMPYRAKFSEDKFTYPGCKQVYRFRGPGGLMDHDIIARHEEEYPGAEPLLQCVMRDGRRLAPSPPLQELQERARHNLAQLPPDYRKLSGAPPYPVHISQALRDLLEEVRSQLLQPALKRNGG